MEPERSRVTRVLDRGGQTVRVLQTCSIEVNPPVGEPTVVQVSQPVFRIGSHPSNDLVLGDETVSKLHLELTAGPDGYQLLDLSSSNGTFLGNARVGEIRFVSPVTVWAGNTRLFFQPGKDEAEVEAAVEPRFGTVIGRSVVMRELFAQLARVAASECPIVLEGETGVGKEMIAESVHRASSRGGNPFVVVDCGAVAGDVIDSELFGHVRGAFTDAEEDRQGLFEMADGGTLFLDEIGELPTRVQVKLLGVLDRGTVTRVGSAKSRAVDVRVVAATHRDLARDVNEGRFRADLFYRLAVVRLRVPPLRERLDDLPLLVAAALDRLRSRGDYEVPDGLPAVVLARLAAQPWPGNVRELFNAVERAVLALEKEAMVRPPSLPSEHYQDARDRFLDTFREQFLLDAIRESGGRVTEAARTIGLDTRYLRRLLARYNISAADHRRR